MLAVKKLDSRFRLVWWAKGDTVSSLRGSIKSCQQVASPNSKYASYMPTFIKCKGLALVYTDNEMEGTLPIGTSQQVTYQMLDKVVDDNTVDYLPDSVVVWDADGGNPPDKARAQLQQHMLALKFLCLDKEYLPDLTPDLVKKTHKILMWGAQHDGRNLRAGEYRESGALSGTGFVYAQPAEIATGVEAVVQDFHAGLSLVACGEMDVEVLAARLFYSMVILHPFENGNGRLCRLLVAYAMKKSGSEPFPLSISNGHKAARQNYQQVLRHADAHQGSIKRLAALILECRNFSWQNYRLNAVMWQCRRRPATGAKAFEGAGLGRAVLPSMCELQLQTRAHKRPSVT